MTGSAPWRSSVFGLLLTLGSVPVFAHGASRGLHLHPFPDPARAGARIEVDVDAERPMTRLTLGIVDGEAQTIEPERPTRSLTVTLTLPESARVVVNLHAEAQVNDGRRLRASAVVRIEQDEGFAPGAQGTTSILSNARAAPLPSVATTHGAVGLRPKP